MTVDLSGVELYGLDSPHAVVFVLAHLLPLAGSPDALGQAHTEKSPAPFRSVNLIHEHDDVDDTGQSVADVSVHTFAKAVAGVDANTMAIRESKLTHRRMLVLAHNPLTDVVMPDGTIANCDWFETVEKPFLTDYRDANLARTKAVYRLGLSLVAV